MNLHISKSNFANIQEQGFLPLYKRTKITDALHEIYGFRTDFEFIMKSQMKTIQKKVKEKSKILYFVTTHKNAAMLDNTGIAAFLFLINCQKWDYNIYYLTNPLQIYNHFYKIILLPIIFGDKKLHFIDSPPGDVLTRE